MIGDRQFTAGKFVREEKKRCCGAVFLIGATACRRKEVNAWENDGRGSGGPGKVLLWEARDASLLALHCSTTWELHISTAAHYIQIMLDQTHKAQTMLRYVYLPKDVSGWDGQRKLTCRRFHTQLCEAAQQSKASSPLGTHWVSDRGSLTVGGMTDHKVIVH